MMLWFLPFPTRLRAGGGRPAPRGAAGLGERPPGRRVEALPAALREDQDHGVLRGERRELSAD